MTPFSVIVFGFVVWAIAVSGAKQLRFRFFNGLVWTGPKKTTTATATAGNVTKQKV